MYFWVGQVILDVKRGKLLHVLAVGPRNAVVTDWEEADWAPAQGLMVVKELEPGHMVNWGAWDD